MCIVTNPHHGAAALSDLDIPALPVARKPSLRRSSSPKSVVEPKKSVRFAPTEDESEDGYVLVSTSKNLASEDTTGPVRTTVHPCVLPPASTMSEKEKAAFWWQPHDYEIFSGTARLIAGEIRRRAAAMSAAAARSVGQSNIKAHSESYANVLTKTLQACSSYASGNYNSYEEEGEHVNPLNPKLFDYLAHWTRSGHSRRGLERWSVAYHGEKRNLDRAEQVKAVLDAQADLKTKGEDLLKDETIARASFEKSRTARLFALAIGQADAAAVGYGATEKDDGGAKVGA